MAFEIRQVQKLVQQLVMTPQLQQAIKLLQLSRIELEEMVVKELEENPALEEGPTEEADNSEHANAEAQQSAAANDLATQKGVGIISTSVNLCGVPKDQIGGWGIVESILASSNTFRRHRAEVDLRPSLSVQKVCR